MTVQTPMLEIASLIAEAGGGQMDACMQCGTCTGVCPWPTVGGVSPRRVIRHASLGLEGWESEWVWRCVTCGACVPRCPRGIDIITIMCSARRVLVESGSAPRTIGGPMASLRAHGNPWEGTVESRRGWSADFPVSAGPCEVLWLPCCTHVYDARNRESARSFARLLHRAGANWAVPDSSLRCCGEQAGKLGAAEIATDLMEHNAALVESSGAEQVVTSSPHCLESYRLAGVRCRHTTELLWQWAERGRLGAPGVYARRVTYHDPCYLGRHAGIWDPPRLLLRWVREVEFVEMRRNGADSLCCGGGGGGVFQETPAEQRFAVLRVREALETGASVLATACPYCVLMFEDAIKVLGAEDRIEVRTVEEIVAASLMSSGSGP